MGLHLGLEENLEKKVRITQYLSCLRKEKNYENTGLFSNSGQLLIRPWTEFSLNDRPKGAQDTPGLSSFILPQLGLFWKRFLLNKLSMLY